LEFLLEAKVLMRLGLKLCFLLLLHPDVGVSKILKGNHHHRDVIKCPFL
jgi:hypothetical protein